MFLRVCSQLFCIPPINISKYEDDAIEAEENEEIEEKDESSQSSSNASYFKTRYTFFVMKHTTLRMLSQNCAKFMALYALFLLARVLKRVKTRL